MDLACRTPEQEVAALQQELAAVRAQLGTRAPMPGRSRRLRSTATRPTAAASARATTWQASAAPSRPTRSPGMMRCVEAEITGRPAPERLARRQARSKPLLDDLKTWMEAQRRRASGKTALGKALQYALGRWEALARYAEDDRLAIDNNLAERLLRGIAVSRKNFLFLGSNAGGERAAILYTLIETAKLHSLNPEAYLAHVIDQLARGHRASRLADLLPWNCKNAVSP